MNTRDVGAPGDAGEPRAPRRARREVVGPDEGELAEGLVGHRAGWRSRRRSRAASRRCSAAAPADARWAKRARHRGRHARAARQRPLLRKPIVGADGRGARDGGRAQRGAAVTLSRRTPGRGARRASTSCRCRPPPTSAGRRWPAADADVILMAAAVSDYRPAEALDGKATEERRALDGRPRPDADVARALGGGEA